MTRLRSASYLSLLYVVGLLALLAVLAVFQYRWTGEASLAEQERMRQGLNESLGYFQRSFDREISKVISTYCGLPWSAVADAEDWQSPLTSLLIEAARQWQASATDPRLIRQVLVAAVTPGSQDSLYSFSADSGRLESVEWADDLAGLRNHFPPDPVMARQGGTQDGYQRRHLPSDFIIDEIPALVHVLSNQTAMRRRERTEPGTPITDDPRFYVIIRLDRDYLFEQRIPELARQYLSRDTDSGYHYAVTSRQNPGLVLASTAGRDPSGIIASPDARVNLIRLVEEGFEIRQRGQALPEAEDGHVRRRSLSRQGGGGGAPAIEAPDLDRAVHESSLERYRNLQAAAEILGSRGWELLAKHRSGSLNAAVASTRLRNLGVSLGILLLLAVSLVVLAVSVRRAQRLGRQQMEFVAGVSHELRTPIAVICSTAENLADGVITANEQVRRYGQYILREGWRLDTLVEQTLEFAGIGSGIRRFHMEPVDLGDLISDAVDALRTQIAEKQLKVDVSTEPRACVNGDGAALSCAIGNLLNNAVKYSRPGGQIRVALEPRAETVVLEVADEGIGIEAKETRHLFEPFFRGSNALRAQIRGAGIGLSLVKSIVEAHSGTISVKSKIQEGSVFTLVLPAVRVPSVQEKHEVT